MTTEEQLDWLCRLRSEIYVYMPKEWLIPMNNALDMAIKALEQEPTTKNDLGVDCIPRIEVIDYLCKHCPDDGECFEDCDEIKYLRQMPSATPQEPREITLEDVKGYCKPRCLTIITNELLYELTHPKIKALEQEPKTGHWNDIPKYKDIAWQCSECEHFTTMQHNYCPNCGAKMDKGEDHGTEVN